MHVVLPLKLQSKQPNKLLLLKLISNDLYDNRLSSSKLPLSSKLLFNPLVLLFNSKFLCNRLVLRFNLERCRQYRDFSKLLLYSSKLNRCLLTCRLFNSPFNGVSFQGLRKACLCSHLRSNRRQTLFRYLMECLRCLNSNLRNS